MYTIKENCWIKADPTFEGLKQIVYEPATRVHVGVHSPSWINRHNYISTLNFSGAVFENYDILYFKDEQRIDLNQNMVALIGGRGKEKAFYWSAWEVKN